MVLPMTSTAPQYLVLTPVALLRELDADAREQGKYTCVRCLGLSKDTGFCDWCKAELDEESAS